MERQGSYFTAFSPGREARGHGPPKPLSLSILGALVARLTPSSPATPQRSQTLATVSRTGRRETCTGARRSSPHLGRVVRLVPRSSHSAAGRSSLSPVQAVTRQPANINSSACPRTPNSIVTPIQPPRLQNGSIHSRLILLSLVSLFTEVWLLYPLKHRVRDISPGT